MWFVDWWIAAVGSTIFWQKVDPHTHWHVHRLSDDDRLTRAQ
jgi:hypothetical protein